MSSRKRRSDPSSHPQAAEPCVDDMAIAAHYATATAPMIPVPDPAMDTEDEHEIDLEESFSASSTNASVTAPKSNDGMSTPGAGARSDHTEATKEEEDSSDAESDVDLTEQLARMVDDGEDHGDATGIHCYGSKNANGTDTPSTIQPRTANEIDAYTTDLTDLQDQFQWNVQLLTPTTAQSNDNAMLEEQWEMAGHIQHHMVEDRTVTVRSSQAPLREGCVLAVRTDDETTTTFIVLGAIFEVFGPVSQPFYSIRLNKPKVVVESSCPKTVLSAEDVETTSCGSEKDCSADKDSTPVIDTAMAMTNGSIESKSADLHASDGKTGLDSSTDGLPPSSQEGEKEHVAEAGCTSTLSDSPDTKIKETPEPEVAPTVVIDPWSKTGEYTKLLRENKKLPVYYRKEGTVGGDTQFLDPAAIYRSSGRGCDASNVYDEEILDKDVEYYSDDEKERLSKKKGRGRNRSNQQPNSRGSHGRNPNTYANSTPQGFHPHMQQQQWHPHAPQHHGHVMQPPPPRSNQSPYYSQHQSMPPPPPPPPPQYNYTYTDRRQQQGFYPNNGAPQQPNQPGGPPPPPPPLRPPQEDQSDTVYYDFS